MDLLPWGITANLLIRHRSNSSNKRIRFDLAFIKTGGGEDIDFCLQLNIWPLKAVANAVCFHPWWNNGARTYDHFYRWAYGDSLLINKYTNHTYFNFPNVIETIFFRILIALLFWFRYDFATFSSFSVMTSSLLLLVECFSLLLIDMSMDVFRNHFSPDRICLQAHATGWFRVLASMESNVIKNSAELGHFVGPLCRGHFFNCCCRFDWFCGLYENVVSSERVKAFYRFVAFIIVLYLFKQLQ
eukprot:gene7072-9652_t